MKKTLIITFFAVLSVLFYGLSIWFEQETYKVSKINKEHLVQIQRLKKIEKINKWLDKKIKPFIETLPKTQNMSDMQLVDFFDKHSTQLDFEVSRYIYKEDLTYKMDINFNVPRNDKQKLTYLMELKYKYGYLQFKTLKTFDKYVKGSLEIIQPIKSDINESK
jgi:hypothetical protein